MPNPFFILGAGGFFGMLITCFVLDHEENKKRQNKAKQKMLTGIEILCGIIWIIGWLFAISEDNVEVALGLIICCAPVAFLFMTLIGAIGCIGMTPDNPKFKGRMIRTIITAILTIVGFEIAIHTRGMFVP